MWLSISNYHNYFIVVYRVGTEAVADFQGAVATITELFTDKEIKEV